MAQAAILRTTSSIYYVRYGVNDEVEAVLSSTRASRPARIKLDAGKISSPHCSSASPVQKAVESVGNDSLKLSDFVVGQRIEFALAPLFRKRSAILPDEHDDVFRQPVRHLDRVHDTAKRFVVTAQILDLARQIVFDRMAHAGVQKFSGSSEIEIAVEIGRIIENLHVAVRGGPPVDKRHQGAGVRLKRRPVEINPVKHDRGDWKHHTRRRKPAVGKHVMDQAAMKPAVSIL